MQLETLIVDHIFSVHNNTHKQQLIHYLDYVLFTCSCKFIGNFAAAVTRQQSAHTEPSLGDCQHQAY